jgi:hypothetical protein
VAPLIKRAKPNNTSRTTSTYLFNNKNYKLKD